MLIDFSIPCTIPKEIESFVLDYLRNTLTKEQIDIIKSKKVNGDDNIDVLIENIFDYRCLSKFKDDLSFLLNKYNFIGYHATRISDKNYINNVGLKCFNWEWYRDFIYKILNSSNIPDDTINKALGYLRDEYDHKYGTVNYLYLYSHPQLTYCDDKPEYSKFCKNIGGEIAERGLEEKMPEILEVLKQSGAPVVIKFKARLNDIAFFDKHKPANEIIKYVLAKNYWNFYSPIYFDAALAVDISPEYIMEIIPIQLGENYE